METLLLIVKYVTDVATWIVEHSSDLGDYVRRVYDWFC